MWILRQPCLGRVSVSPARGDWDWYTVSRYLQAFVLWRLSLAVCCVSSESQSNSSRISASVSEQRNRRPFSTDVLATLTLFLLVQLNPAVSRDVRPTPGFPALTSRARKSLSFVFLIPPAAQPPHAGSRSSRSQSGSSEHTRVPEFREMLGGACSWLTVSVCCLEGAGPGSTHSPVQVATASWRLDTAAPAPFCLSSYICAWFHGSPLCTSILSAGDVHL